MKEHHLTVFASLVGYHAKELCRRSTIGKVIGATSTGIFLMGEDQRVLFLSYQKIPGPWSVLFSTPPVSLKDISLGMKATFSEESIRIEEADLLIDLSIAATWLTPAIPQPVFSRNSVITNLQATVNSYLAIKEPDGLAVLLPHLQGYSKKPALDETLQPVWEKIQKIRTALQQGEVKTLVKAFSALLGQGRGLTPAGDDCITGVLLGLIRSSSQIFTPLEIYYLKETILSEAFQRTTALSACQIEAAAEGSADLRLINALDGILTGSPESTACAIQLSDYGHSSGGDALVGFVAALGNPVS